MSDCDDTMMVEGEPLTSDTGTLTRYQRPQSGANGGSGPLVVMNMEAQAVIRSQLHSFLAATQREVLSISRAQDTNNNEMRLQLEHALDAMLARVRADTESNVQLSHDELFRALAARVDAGVEHISTMRRSVEERAVEVAESHLSALVTASRNGITNELIQAVEDRVQGNINRAVGEAKEVVETRALAVAENRLTRAEDQLRTRLHAALYESLQKRLSETISSARGDIEERALAVVKSNVQNALEESQSHLFGRVEHHTTERLARGVQDAIVSIKDTARDRVVEVAEQIFGSLAAGTRKDLDELIETRLNASFSERLTNSINEAIATIQQNVEDRALTVVQDRAITNVEERAIVSVQERALAAVKDRALAIVEEHVLATRATTNTLELDDGTLQRAITTAIDSHFAERVEEKALVAVKDRALAIVEEHVLATRATTNTLELDDGTLQRAITTAIDSHFAERVEEKALAAVKDRALAIVEEHVLATRATTNTLELDDGTLQRAITTAIDSHFAERVEEKALVAVKDRALAIVEEHVLATRATTNTLHLGDATLQRAIDDMKDAAIESVKCYESTGQRILDDRCSQTLSRLESRVQTALSEAKRQARLEASAVAQRSEKKLLDMHEKLIREALAGSSSLTNTKLPMMSSQARATSEPEAPSTARVLGVTSATKKESLGAVAPVTKVENQLSQQSAIQGGGNVTESAVHEIEIALGELKIRVRSRPSNASPFDADEPANAPVPHSRLAASVGAQFDREVAPAVAAAKKELMSSIDTAVKQLKRRSEAEKAAQKSLSEMQARIRARSAANADGQANNMSEAGKRRLLDIVSALEDY